MTIQVTDQSATLKAIYFSTPISGWVRTSWISEDGLIVAE